MHEGSIDMDKGHASVSIPRREFLGYCGATAALIATTASSWAAQTGALDADRMAKALRTLADTLEGDLLLPEDERFEPTRGISWNLMLPDRRPGDSSVTKTPD